MQGTVHPRGRILKSKKAKWRMKGKQQNRRNHRFKKRFRGKKGKKSIDLGKRKVGKEEAEG
jgi:hypothetical protein